MLTRPLSKGDFFYPPYLPHVLQISRFLNFSASKRVIMCPRNQWRYALVFAGLAMMQSFAPALGQISSDPWADSV
ncbi:MAG: hypothetical protein D6814_08765, partial [Calditrichaeota bacterium]